MNNNIIKAVAMLSLTAFSLNSFAGYTYFLQMEGGAGGLPKGTIAFVEKSSSTPPVNNGGNEGGTGTDPEQTDPTEPTEPTDPEEPFDPVVQCSNNASQIGQVLLSSGYSDINVASYAYRMSFTEAGGEKERCTVTLNIPNSKMSPCVSNNSYRTSAVSYLEANFDVMQPIETTWRYSYYGSCSN